MKMHKSKYNNYLIVPKKHALTLVEIKVKS